MSKPGITSKYIYKIIITELLVFSDTICFQSIQLVGVKQTTKRLPYVLRGEMKYLVAVDGSESSTEALEYALDLATRAGGSLVVAYAVEPRVLVEGGEEAPTNAEVGQRIYTEDIEVAEERGEEVLEDVRDRAEEAGVAVETTLLYGDPVDTVADYAEDEGVDGIVVGHRGLSGRVEGMVGSVAKGLVGHATVPVTVVK